MNINNKHIVGNGARRNSTDVTLNVIVLPMILNGTEFGILKKFFGLLSHRNNFDRRIASSISNAIYRMKATNQCLILSLSNLSRYSSSEW